MNRIQAAYDRMEAQIKQRVADGIVTAEKVAESCASLDMEFDEYVRFQSLKSLAVADQSITPEEGQTIYIALGESLDTFNGQPVHIKAVLTGIYKEMLGKEIRLRQAS